jgi:LysR family carnitine catabolism transcriptional activator
MIDNLRHIRAFLVVARIGNFTRAAVELRMSQSALTVQIKQLENDLGITLFDRGKRKVSLTQAGQDLLLPLERILIDAEAIVSRTNELSGLRRGIVTMAVLPSIASRLIPAAVARFAKLHPGVVVQIQDIVAEKIVEAVKREDVDFGIGSRMRPDRELKTMPLLLDRLFAFVPKSHALASQRSVTFHQIASSPLILTGKDSSVRAMVESAFKGEEIPLAFAYETNYMSTALGLVNAGLGVAILPETAIDDESSSNIKKLLIQKPDLSRKIDLIQKRDRTLSPAASKMVQILKQLTARAT